ncbi:MAG: L-ascorbate 6-phosphate lactonase, partial [Staphylococcus lugdunensis]|nr:L-ascorbate 6-phosphate lactonase [Staphylococcus lugdunensis]
KLQPNLRVQPMVIDPFAINELDYYLVSHYHSDHIDINTAAAIFNNPKLNHVKFVGPHECARIWKEWGVSEDRIITIKPGESFEFKDVKVTAVESFDRTCLVTLPVEGSEENDNNLKGLPVTDEEMARKSVNYVFETPGGTIYHGADSHFSNYFAKHGKDFKIDVVLNNYGDNPVGIQDKMTSIDLLRMAENLNAKVIIPVHYDIWSNFMASTNEIIELWKMRKDRLQYQFHPFIWEVGGKYTYPEDKDKIEYHHPRGFDDAFEQPSNIQFKALL